MISLEKNFLMHEPGRRPEAPSGEPKKRTCARRLREQRRVPLAKAGPRAVESLAGLASQMVRGGWGALFAQALLLIAAPSLAHLACQ